MWRVSFGDEIKSREIQTPFLFALSHYFKFCCEIQLAEYFHFSLDCIT